MSTFKIGDRVVLNEDCGSPRDRGRMAVITGFDGALWPVQLRLLDSGAAGVCHYREIDLVARKPKPLTRTGGKARFTVRHGHRLLAQPRVLSAMRGDGASYTLFIRERS